MHTDITRLKMVIGFLLLLILVTSQVLIQDNKNERYSTIGDTTTVELINPESNEVFNRHRTELSFRISSTTPYSYKVLVNGNKIRSIDNHVPDNQTVNLEIDGLKPKKHTWSVIIESAGNNTRISDRFRTTKNLPIADIDLRHVSNISEVNPANLTYRIKPYEPLKYEIVLDNKSITDLKTIENETEESEIIDLSKGNYSWHVNVESDKTGEKSKSKTLNFTVQ